MSYTDEIIFKIHRKHNLRYKMYKGVHLIWFMNTTAQLSSIFSGAAVSFASASYCTACDSTGRTRPSPRQRSRQGQASGQRPHYRHRNDFGTKYASGTAIGWQHFAPWCFLPDSTAQEGAHPRLDDGAARLSPSWPPAAAVLARAADPCGPAPTGWPHATATAFRYRWIRMIWLLLILCPWQD